jgi:hypothetical protein
MIMIGKGNREGEGESLVASPFPLPGSPFPELPFPRGATKELTRANP